MLNNRQLLTAGIALSLGACLGFAQDRSYTRTAIGKLLVPEGTELTLAFAQDLSSKTAAEGDTVNFSLAEDLTVDGVIVARAGAKAIGEVTNAKKAGMMGKGGELNVRLERLTVGEAKVRIRGSKGREGDSEVGTAVALTVLFGPVGLLKHGKEIDIKQGTTLAAFVAEDTTLPTPNIEEQ